MPDLATTPVARPEMFGPNPFVNPRGMKRGAGGDAEGDDKRSRTGEYVCRICNQPGVSHGHRCDPSVSHDGRLIVPVSSDPAQYPGLSGKGQQTSAASTRVYVSPVQPIRALDPGLSGTPGWGEKGDQDVDDGRVLVLSRQHQLRVSGIVCVFSGMVRADRFNRRVCAS